jgi:hypothetical protein
MPKVAYLIPVFPVFHRACVLSAALVVGGLG